MVKPSQRASGSGLFDWCKQYSLAVGRVIIFLMRFDGVVISAKLPRAEQEKTGSYHRMLAIDDILKDTPLVYADWNPLPKNPYLTYSFWGTGKQGRVIYSMASWGHTFLICLCLLRCRKVYFHHVASIRPLFKLALRLPFITSFIDFHGAAPEEHEAAGLHDMVGAMEALEKTAINHVEYYIIVTDAMRLHLETKYANITGTFILLPIIQPYTHKKIPAHIPGELYSVIYAGNTQQWQQIPRMIEIMAKTADKYHYVICCSDPETFNKLLPEKLSYILRAVSMPHGELLGLYQKCHYGLALREDTVVNRVACPTKLVEYLAHGIVPVIDTPNIGDFCTLGMRYLDASSFENSELPDEQKRLAIAWNNRNVFFRLQQQHQDGCNLLREKLGMNRDTTAQEGDLLHP